MDYSADPRLLGGFEQDLRVFDRAVEGGLPASEPHPVGVVEDVGALHRPAQPVTVGEVERRRFHLPAEAVLRVEAAGQRPDADALVEQTPGDVPAGVAEGARDDGETRVRHCVRLLASGPWVDASTSLHAVRTPWQEPQALEDWLNLTLPRAKGSTSKTAAPTWFECLASYDGPSVFLRILKLESAKKDD